MMGRTGFFRMNDLIETHCCMNLFAQERVNDSHFLPAVAKPDDLDTLHCQQLLGECHARGRMRRSPSYQ